MKRLVLILFIAAFAAAASAQTAPKTPASSSTKPGAASAKAPAASAATAATPAPWIKLPPGVPQVSHGPVQIPFSLRYEDIKVGTGAVGEAGKLWHIKYTGWRAADGAKFDSWDDHRQPVIGSDGKQELGPDGKPKFADPEPIAMPQGMGRVIPGFDYGIEGMKIGGKRRIFIPWQMAYGTRAIPDRPDRPGIPAKSDLIFDVELVNVTDIPQPRPPMPMNHPMPPTTLPNPGASAQPGAAPAVPAASAPAGATAPATTPAAPATAVPAQPSASAQPTAPAQPATTAQPQAPPK
ncbi:MAG: FKBP-type peptidyl-prolyl cis-trans isomerase [Terracidiphilus sp.]|jgi:peptidylprolyl isomerase